MLVAGLAIYAWKDWFKSLCGLIVLMAVIEHEDMPRSIMGIQGLNPWNLLMGVILLAWLVNRRREGLRWDMPNHIVVLLVLYLVIVLAGWLRMYVDPSYLEHYPLGSMVSEELINTLKWVIPGVLVYDGCRDRNRLKWLLGSLLILFLLMSAQIIRRIPPSSALGGGGADMQRIRLKACQSVGYSSVEMAVLLAGASWAFFATMIWARRRWQRLLLALAAVTMMYATALTGGRAGYVAWAAVGLVFCAMRWRKFLLAAPLAPIVLAVLFPAAVERMLFGFGEVAPSGQETINTHELSSGRLVVWPYVLEKIADSPAIGYGRRAMIRTGLTNRLAHDLGEFDAFPHPHNMYLEWLLDNGVIGLIPVAAFFCIMVRWTGGLFLDRRDRLFAAAGGICLALLVSELVGGLTSQHFYPQESTLAMWVGLMLAMRLHVERQRAFVEQRAVAMAGSLTTDRGATAPAFALGQPFSR